MERDEVLEKSKKEENDEFETNVFKNSQTFSIIVLIIICVLFLVANAIISDIKGLETGIISFDYAAILSAYVSGIFFYNFSKLKNRFHFIAGITFFLIFICMAFLYFSNLIG